MIQFLYQSLAPLAAISAVLIWINSPKGLRLPPRDFLIAARHAAIGYLVYLFGLVLVFGNGGPEAVVSYGLGAALFLLSSVFMLAIMAGLLQAYKANIAGATRALIVLFFILVGVSVSMEAGQALIFKAGGGPNLIHYLEAKGFTLASPGRNPQYDDGASFRVNLQHTGMWYGQLQYFYGPNADTKATAAADEARRLRTSFGGPDQIENRDFFIFKKSGGNWAIFEALDVMERRDMGDPQFLKTVIDDFDGPGFVGFYPTETYTFLSSRLSVPGILSAPGMTRIQSVLAIPMFMLIALFPTLLAPFIAALYVLAVANLSWLMFARRRLAIGVSVLLIALFASTLSLPRPPRPVAPNAEAPPQDGQAIPQLKVADPKYDQLKLEKVDFRTLQEKVYDRKAKPLRNFMPAVNANGLFLLATDAVFKLDEKTLATVWKAGLSRWSEAKGPRGLPNYRPEDTWRRTFGSYGGGAVKAKQSDGAIRGSALSHIIDAKTGRVIKSAPETNYIDGWATWGDLAYSFEELDYDEEDDAIRLGAHNPKTNKEIWQKTFPLENFKQPDQFLVRVIGFDAAEDRVALATVSQGPGENFAYVYDLFVFDAATGEQLWTQAFETTRTPGSIYIDPGLSKIANGKVFVVIRQQEDNKTLYAFDLGGGGQTWRFDYQAKSEGRPYGLDYEARTRISDLITFDGANVFLGAAGGTIALDQNSGQQLWATGTPARRMGTANDYLLMAAEKKVEALDKTDGKTLFSFEADSPINYVTAQANQAYFASEGGSLYRLGR